MNNRKDLAEEQLQIPRLIKPRHRPSFLELASALLGPKGFFIGLFAGLVAVGGGRYLQSAFRASSPPNAQKIERARQVVESPSGKLAADQSANQSTESSTDKSAGQSTDRSTGQSTGRSTGPTQSVTLHTAKLSTVENTVTLTGTVAPKSLLSITPAMGGVKILEMRVEPGDRVAAGETLAVLDNRILRAQLAQAEAQMAAAQSEVSQQLAALGQAQVLQQAANTEVGRYATLYERGAISQQQLGERQVQTLTTQQEVVSANAELGSARASIASQMAEISRLQAQLDQTVVAAPTAGTIAEKLTTLGATADLGTPVYSLIEDSQLMLKVHPTQAQLKQIEVGSSVAISSTEAANALQLRGQVATIEPTLDAKSRQATVKISLPEAAMAQTGNRLRSGMFLQATLVTARRRSVRVPAAAVITQPDGTSVVYTVSDRANEQAKAIANVVTVSAAPAPEDSVEILSGLVPGSRVVVGGASYLQAGDLVAVVANAAPEGLLEETSKEPENTHEL